MMTSADMSGANPPSQVVACGRHGHRAPAYVCQHLSQALPGQTSVGLNLVYDDDGHANAWCDTCDAFLHADGGEWNDETEAHAQISLICDGCLEELKTFNSVKDWN